MSDSLSKNQEIRKLQITGGSTYILSLPKKWVEEMGLKQQDNLAIVRQNDSSLLIIPEKPQKTQRPAEATIEIRSDDEPDSTIRKLVATYLVGFTEIRIRTKKGRLDPMLRNVLKEFIRKMLMGTEILAETPQELRLKILLSYPELSVQSALRRMSRITISMHQDAVQALKDLDTDLTHEVIRMDDEVDRFSLYIIRQLKAAVQIGRIINEIGLSTGRDVLGYRLIVKSIERTADHALEIAKHTETLKNPLDPELYSQIEAMSGSTIAVFKEAIGTLFSRDFQKANEIVQRAKQIAQTEKELVSSILKRPNAEDVANLNLIIESIRRAAEYASDIAEIVLNLSVEQIITTTTEKRINNSVIQ